MALGSNNIKLDAFWWFGVRFAWVSGSLVKYVITSPATELAIIFLLVISVHFNDHHAIPLDKLPC
jgi:hypothetical protein